MRRSTSGDYSTPAYTEPEALADAWKRISRQLRRDPLTVGPTSPNMNGFSIFERCSERDIEELLGYCYKSARGKRAMGALVGMAVADSVGANFEFIPIDQKGCKFDPKSLKVVGALNKFSLKPGQWTDDTSMGLCLADSLLARGNYDGTDIRVRFWNWWYKGYNNAFRLEPSRNKSVGLGGNISQSLTDINESNPPPRFTADSEDAGNGSLMRLSPVPIFYHTDMELAMLVSAESSYTTHPGPVAADACAFLGFLIVRALTRDPNSRDSFQKWLEQCVTDYCAFPDIASKPAMMKLCQSAEPEGSTERCWNWRDPGGPYLMETVSARGSDYNGYPVSKGYVGSYSMDGLAIAMHSLYHTTSFMAALARCVNLLGDADSTGAILGQLGGAFYGIDAIDKRLIQRLRQWDNGEIGLRAALLYAKGVDLPIELKNNARRMVGLETIFDPNAPSSPSPLKKNSAMPAAPPVVALTDVSREKPSPSKKATPKGRPRKSNAENGQNSSNATDDPEKAARNAKARWTQFSLGKDIPAEVLEFQESLQKEMPDEDDIEPLFRHSNSKLTAFSLGNEVTEEVLRVQAMLQESMRQDDDEEEREDEDDSQTGASRSQSSSPRSIKSTKSNPPKCPPKARRPSLLHGVNNDSENHDGATNDSGNDVAVSDSKRHREL